MLKLVGSILIISSFLYAGCCAALTLKKRVRFLNDMLCAIVSARSEIVSRFTPVADVFKLLSESYDGDAGELFYDLHTALEGSGDVNLSDVWNRGIKRLVYLTREDADTISRYGDILGRYEPSCQGLAMDGITERLKLRLSIAEKEYEQRAGLYRGCGLGLGIIAVLVII